MRFIRGQEFRKVIRQFHENRLASKAALDGVSFRQLLRRFLDVCNAIDYAHSRGILHRDLKPANIMLGSHGETLVVDWGLAKILGDDQELRTDERDLDSEDKPKRVRFSGTTADTMQGTFCGTVAYAPPEQLSGFIEKLCPASDVYSLGAILYELITKEPPISQKPESLGQVVEWIRDPAFANARLCNTEIPRSLAMISKKAMAFEIADRYPNARELGLDLERWLADERVLAFGSHEPLVEKIGRLMRRYRRWTVPVAAAIVFSTIIALVGAWLINNARVQEILAKKTAVQNKNDAVSRIGVARSAIDTLLIGSTESLGDFPAARDLQKRLLEVAANDYAKLSASKSNDLELELERIRALVRVADIQHMQSKLVQSEYDEAYKNYQIAISELQTQTNKLVGDDRIVLLWKIELAKTIGRMAFALDLEGRSEESQTEFDLALSQLRALAVKNPKSSDVHAALGKTLIRAANSRSIIEKPVAVIQKIEEALASLEHVDLLKDSVLALMRIQANQSMAKALGKMNRNDEAIAIFEQTLASIARFMAEHPADREWLNAQADSRVFRAVIHRRMGSYLLAKQDSVAALETYQQLKRDWPDNLTFRELAASAATNVGLLLLDEGQPFDSIPFLESSIREYSELRSEYPRVASYGDGLGSALSGLGQAELRTNPQADLPIALLRESDSIYGSLAEQNSESKSSLAYYVAKSASVRGQLAQAYQRMENALQARHWYNESLSLFQQLIDLNDTNSDYQYATAEVEWRRGLFEWEEEDQSQANKLTASSLERMRNLALEYSENAQYHYRLAEILVHGPDVTMDYSREADNHLQIATELQTTNTEFVNLWAEVKVRLNEVEPATKLLADLFAIRGSRSARDFGVLALLDCQSGNRKGAYTNLTSCRELVAAQQPHDPDLNRWILSIERSIDQIP